MLMVGLKGPSDRRCNETALSLVELGLLPSFCPEERLRELGHVAQPHSYYPLKLCLEPRLTLFQSLWGFSQSHALPHCSVSLGLSLLVS